MRGGFDQVDGVVGCKQCGEVIKRAGVSVFADRKARVIPKFCSKECAKEYKAKKKLQRMLEDHERRHG